MTAEEQVACVRPWRDRICRIARAYSLDPFLVAAVVVQESEGNTFAIRPEMGFWARYLPGIMKLFQRTPSKRDDQWAAFPQLASASYGLMQVLYVTAIELGAVLMYPTELCNPDVGLEYGCRKLADCLHRANGDVGVALRLYNGGFYYAGDVLGHRSILQRTAPDLFPAGG